MGLNAPAPEAPPLPAAAAAADELELAPPGDPEAPEPAAGKERGKSEVSFKVSGAWLRWLCLRGAAA